MRHENLGIPNNEIANSLSEGYVAALLGSGMTDWAEQLASRGRADAILKDKSGVYVFEFKYGKTAQEALAQARTKEYSGPWLDGAPPVFYVGVNYDPAKRGIDDSLVEPA